MATASEDGTAKLWTIDGRLFGIVDQNTDGCSKCLHKAAKTGRLLGIIDKNASGVYGVSFSKDGKMIATANVDKTAKIWFSHDGRNITTLKGHKGEVFAARFSPNGEMIATKER